MVRQDEVAPLPLDPGGYGGTYKLLGGRPSLDLVNTISYPGTDRAHDWFDRPEHVIVWSQALGLIGEEVGDRLRQAADGARSLQALLSPVHARRELIRAVLSPLAHGDVVPRATLDALNRLLGQVLVHRKVHTRDLSWTWGEPSHLEDVLNPVVLDAAVVLTEGDHRRLGYCPGCDWLFYDVSRNRSRRWCDMADCGSRDKALRYYHRRKREEGR